MMCIICKIIEGELPSYKVYEDERTLAFLDINPVSDGHVLLVPKHHEALFMVLRKLVKPIQDAFDAPASNIIINNGPNAGQIIPHVHILIIPRPRPIGRNMFSSLSREKPRSKDYFEEIAVKVRAEIE
jgi:histidine triad (HIT) family protein